MLFCLPHTPGFGHRRRDEELRTPNVVIPLRVTLKQLFQGDILEMSYVRQVRGTPWQGMR